MQLAYAVESEEIQDMQVKDIQVKKAFLWLHRRYPQGGACDVGINHSGQCEGAHQHSGGESNAHIS